MILPLRKAVLTSCEGYASIPQQAGTNHTSLQHCQACPDTGPALDTSTLVVRQIDDRLEVLAMAPNNA